MIAGESPSGGETTGCVAGETHALEDIVSGPEMEVELVHSNFAESLPSLGLSNLGNRRCKQGGVPSRVSFSLW